MLWRKGSSRIRTAAAIAALFCLTPPSFAHPHVWIVGTTDVLFDPQGRIAALRQHWTFDEMYSAFATEGVGDKNTPPTREQLAPLAQTNVDSLGEFGWFTAARSGSKKLEFDPPRDYWLDTDAKRAVTLHFTLPLKSPVEAKKPFSFQTFDPTFFVSFSNDKDKPATLVDAPAGCSLSAVDPPPLLAADELKLSQAASDNFSPGADLSMKLAARIFVACP